MVLKVMALSLMLGHYIVPAVNLQQQHNFENERKKMLPHDVALSSFVCYFYFVSNFSDPDGSFHFSEGESGCAVGQDHSAGGEGGGRPEQHEHQVLLL